MAIGGGWYEDGRCQQNARADVDAVKRLGRSASDSDEASSRVG